MLDEINNLAPFFEDCYRWIAVREYARITKVSPPTASKLLKSYVKAGYLQSRAERGHLLFALQRENGVVIDLSRLYWKMKLQLLVEAINKRFLDATVVLFGSLNKAEVKPDSDVDIAVFSSEKKVVDAVHFEKILKRKISMQWFTSLHGIKNEHLQNNILNGTVLCGRLRW